MRAFVIFVKQLLLLGFISCSSAFVLNGNSVPNRAADPISCDSIIPPFPRQKSEMSLKMTNDENNDKEVLANLRVAIVGAGPAGLLLAHKLLQLGAQVTVLEGREDFRKTINRPSSRAYALGLGIRGRTAIRSVDETLWQAVKARGYESERFRLYVGPLNIKLRDGTKGKAAGKQEPSVLLFQSDLCIGLLDELERRYLSTGRFTMKFNCKVMETDLIKKQLITGEDSEVLPFDLLVGCDGVNSIVRQSIQSISTEFSSERKVLPGEYKTVRLSEPPPKLDPTSVSLLIPKKGTATAFVEPTVNRTCCILFAGRPGGQENLNPILDPTITNQTALAEFLMDSFPLLEGINITDAKNQLISQTTSTASTVRCNTYHYGECAALAGDAAHATGGVSGQGVSSALVDSVVLADCLQQLYNPTEMTLSLQKALLAYSQRQVPEGTALYELSFPPSSKTIGKRLFSLLNLAIDFVFQGRFGIGQKPLQTILTTSLDSFSDIRKSRDKLYDEPFPDAAHFNRTLEQIYAATTSSE